MNDLSKRLRRIADRVPAGVAVADIGSDHALLPLYLVRSGKTPFAVAGELNAGPYAAAVHAVTSAGLGGCIDVRRGDGLAVLRAGDVECITIAGMGGSLMTAILAEGERVSRLDGVGTLVLQPNVGEDLVRRWLLQRDWVLQDEDILEEDGKIYEILTAVRADASEARKRNDAVYNSAFLPLSWPEARKRELLIEMGPWLLRRRSEQLFVKWRSEIRKLERICRRLEQSDSEESRAKLISMQARIRDIREVLSCLLMDKPSSE